jgi:amidophosphoribosyltransferase
MEGDMSGNLDAYLVEDSDAYRRMVEWVRSYLRLTTLRYQRLDDMIEAIGLPREKLCLYCWTGQSTTYGCMGCEKQLSLL